MNKTKKAAAMLALSMAIFGTLGPFVSLIPLSSGALALCRAILAAALIGAFLLISRQKIPFHSIKKELPLLLLSGAAMGINWILLFEAYKYTTVSVATLSYYFAPIIVTVLCPILFRERMSAKGWICFAMSTLGIILITGIGDMSDGINNLTGIAFGLGAAAFYAAVILLNKFIKNIGGIHRTFLQFISAIIVLIPYVAASGGIGLYKLDNIGTASLLTVGLIHTGITYCMYFSSLKDLPGQKTAILSYIDPLVAVIISVAVMHEPLTPPQAVGGLLILGFTLFSELSIGKNERTSSKMLFLDNPRRKMYNTFRKKCKIKEERISK